MKVQIFLQNQSPIMYNNALSITLSNKKGLKVIGTNYTRIYPLESIKAIMAVED